MSPEVAQLGHGEMSDLSPLSGVKRKSNFGAVRSVDDPGRTSVICENLMALLDLRVLSSCSRRTSKCSSWACSHLKLASGEGFPSLGKAYTACER